MQHFIAYNKALLPIIIVKTNKKSNNERSPDWQCNNEWLVESKHLP